MTPAKPTRRRRRLLGLPLTLAVVLAVAHGLAWHWTTGRMQAGLADWTALRRAEGWTVEHGPPARGGWPWRAELVLPGLRIDGPAGWRAEPVGLDAARLVLRVAPPRLDRLVVAAEGPLWLRLGALALPAVAARLEAAAPLDPAAGGLDLVAEDLRVALPEGEAALRRAQARLDLGLHGAEPALLIGLDAEGLRLPPGAGPAVAAFGPEVAVLALRGALTGPPPLPPSAARARAWRESGGVLDLPHLGLRWGPLGAEGQVRLGLDRVLQPVGAGVLRVEGAPAAIEALAAAGLLPPATARAAQGVAALMSRPPPEGGPARLEAPVTVGGGRIGVAGIPLVALAPLAWP